jgi:trehalose 6-phosphate phosphatase
MCIRLFDVSREVEARINAAPHILLCLDYDGTLTRFAESPVGGTLSTSMDRVLKSLADREGITLAILSGRERADLLGRVAIPGVIYAGNHGLDISGPGFVFVEQGAAGRAHELERLAGRLSDKLEDIPGVQVENKGLTASVHYRNAAADSVEEIRRRVLEGLAGVKSRFLVTPGEKAFEIRPRVDWDKTSAVELIQEHLAEPDALTIYVGDEVADEGVVRAIPDGIAVKVRGEEETATTYMLENPAEVRKFLEWIDEILRHKNPMPSGRLVEA